MLSGEGTNTNFVVFGLTRPELEPTIYHTQGDHANNYTTNVVKLVKKLPVLLLVYNFLSLDLLHVMGNLHTQTSSINTFLSHYKRLLSVNQRIL